MPDSNPRTPKTSLITSKPLSTPIQDILAEISWFFDKTPRFHDTLFEGMLSSLNPRSIQQFWTLVENTDQLTISRAIEIFLSVYHAKTRLRLPSTKKYIEIHENKEYINWSNFWAEFGLVNNVTPPDLSGFQVETNLSEVLHEIRDFRETATLKLQVALNEYLGEIAQTQRPEGTTGKPADLLPYDNKQLIVDFVNSNLEKLGLAIQYKGQPCHFTCLKGTSEGRFGLVPKGFGTALLARSNLSDFLPLELMDATPSLEITEFVRKEQARRNASRTSKRE